LGVGLTTPSQKKINVKKPEAMPAGRKEQMARHSKGGQGLKLAVVPQKKKKRRRRRKLGCLLQLLFS
jgi:hypothetical protein